MPSMLIVWLVRRNSYLLLIYDSTIYWSSDCCIVYVLPYEICANYIHVWYILETADSSLVWLSHCARENWMWLLYTSFNKIEGGYTGFTLSVCPSICPSICLSVHLCLLCIFHNTCWIHFIFTHLIKQRQATSEGALCEKVFSQLKNLKFWHILEICNFNFVLFGLGIQYKSIVWVIMGWRGYPRNAGILVVLVIVQFPYKS